MLIVIFTVFLKAALKICNSYLMWQPLREDRPRRDLEHTEYHAAASKTNHNVKISFQWVSLTASNFIDHVSKHKAKSWHGSPKDHARKGTDDHKHFISKVSIFANNCRKGNFLGCFVFRMIFDFYLGIIFGNLFCNNIMQLTSFIIILSSRRRVSCCLITFHWLFQLWIQFTLLCSTSPFWFTHISCVNLNAWRLNVLQTFIIHVYLIQHLLKTYKI